MKLQEKQEKIKSESVSVKSRRSFLQNLFASTASVAVLGATLATTNTATVANTKPTPPIVDPIRKSSDVEPLSVDEAKDFILQVKKAVNGKTRKIRGNALRSISQLIMSRNEGSRMGLLTTLALAAMCEGADACDREAFMDEAILFLEKASEDVKERIANRL